MSLRRRFLAATAAAVVAIVLLAVIVAVQFWTASASQRALLDQLAPAADDSASLVLAQTDASSSLADHLILNDDASLAQYGAALARAESLQATLDETITDDMPELSDLQAASMRTQKAWVATDAEPALALMADDRQVRAARQYSSPQARAAYADMIAASQALHARINAIRDAAAASVTGFTTRLGLVLLVVGLLVAAGIALLLAAVRQWILMPLAYVRKDLRRAAQHGSHDDPIDQVGPPEIAAVAHDAESLRRELLAEIDEARAAREGLLQDAPLVAAMRTELQGQPLLTGDFVTLAGRTAAAEGVMSGDWWDLVERPDGSIAALIADASGHGPEAAVAAVRVRNVLRSALEAGLPLDQVAQMGAQACSHGDHFVTALVMEVRSDGTLRWVNAGHHPALAVTSDKVATTLDASGPLLSVLGGTWSVHERALEPGELVLAYTDGLVEARDEAGEELGLASVETFVRGLDAHVRTDAAEAVERVIANTRFRAADWRRDDVTVIGLVYRP